MSIKSKNHSATIMVPTMWRQVPSRIKNLWWKRDPSSPLQHQQQSPINNHPKLKSSLLHRIFPPSNSHHHSNTLIESSSSNNTTTTKKKKHSSIKLKKNQWSHSNNSSGNFHDIELYNSEVPLRANLMSFFTSTSLKEQQIGWSNFLSTPIDKLDFISRAYIGTLSKLRSISHYTMEQQISIHHILARIQHQSTAVTQMADQQQPTKKNKKSSSPHHHNNNNSNSSFSSLITTMNHTTPGRNSITDSILMNNRKPKKTRYIFMLLSTPVSQVANNIHPVTEAISKLRKPYAETFTTISSEEMVVCAAAAASVQQAYPATTTTKKKVTKAKSIVAAFKFVPADYLLDPATLRGCNGEEQEKQQQNRVGGTKIGGGAGDGTAITGHLQKQQSSPKQQQQQQRDLFINTAAAQVAVTTTTTAFKQDATTPIMAKIQIQTN